MLAQAQEALKDQPHVRLERIEVNGGKTAGLPYPPQTGGQLVLEDFAQRRPALLWAVFEWLARWVENGHVRAYTLAEARALYVRAGLRVASEKAFPIDWFWHGWALRADCTGSV